MPDFILSNDYKPFLQYILTRIQSARYEMLKSVSRHTVLLYRDIGKSVSEKAQSQGRGNAVVEQLSQDLQREFPGIRGFSARNIRRMKNFYETYKNNEKLTPLVAELPGGLLLGKPAAEHFSLAPGKTPSEEGSRPREDYY